MAANLQGLEPWLHVSQLKKAPPDIWSFTNTGDLKSNWPGGEVADIWGRELSQDDQTRPVYSLPTVASSLSLSWKDCPCLRFPKACRRGKPLLLIMAFQKQPPYDPLFACFFWRVRKFSIHRSLSFIWTVTCLWALIQIHGLWICNLTGSIIG